MGQRSDVVVRRLLLFTGWAAAALIAGVVAWSAVARLGHEGGTADPTLLTQSEVLRELAQQPGTPESPATVGTPPPSQTPSQSRSTPQPSANGTPKASSKHVQPPVPTRESRSWPLEGGEVGASCRGHLIELVYASPHDGWTMQVVQSGSSRVEVRFFRGASTSTLVAVCVGGYPTAETSGGVGTGDGGSGGTGGGGDAGGEGGD